jgi:minor extracellular serine protease Vpr
MALPMRFRTLPVATLLALFWISAFLPSTAEAARNRYALVLEDPPVATKAESRASMLQSVEAQSRLRQIQTKQQSLRKELESRNIQYGGAVQTLLNAVFVAAAPGRLDELKRIPGVIAVLPVRQYKLQLNQATQLVNTQAAWNTLGGIEHAGDGMKIAILDTGIDQTHPAFQDPSLQVPAGYPICSGSDCNFTNNKVIVARSYVRLLAAGSSPNPAADSRPDDLSPRDRIGHGTATASCAAGALNYSPVVKFSGVAPRAFLGNYKIFGSPQLNDTSGDDIIISALEDAFNDGMDVVSLSVGGPAFSGPLDSGSSCGNAPGVPCDMLAQAIENASSRGMTVVVAAGNAGQDGLGNQTFDTISSPADAPSAIAVGATTNAHGFESTVAVPGNDVPSNLQRIGAQYGDTGPPANPLTAPAKSVTDLGDDGLGCAPFPAGSLNGMIALILRGSCFFSDKVTNAEAAGAVGVILYMADSSSLISPSGLTGTGIPAAMISNSDGLALKSFLASIPGHSVTLDTGLFEIPTSGANLLTLFSSLGPSVGDAAVKPDLVAPGSNMYMATQRYDPLGDMYDASGYVVAAGTSFATPMVSGAAALVKQTHPGFTSAQIKSALVNTASQDVTADESGAAVGVQSIGAGKLDVGAAIQPTLAVSPATLSFGQLKTGAMPASKQLLFTNVSSFPIAATITVAASAGTAPTASQTALNLAPGASGTVDFALSGTLPAAGSYSGTVSIQTASATTRVPYLYLVGTGLAYDIIPFGGGFDGTVGTTSVYGPLAFRLVDRFGLPVSGVPVTFTATAGAGFAGTDFQTDAYGVAAAVPFLGQAPGYYSYTARASGLRANYSGYARYAPAIAANGILDAANPQLGAPLVPGSYVSIFGSDLAESSGPETTTILPVAMDYVFVSFDVPSAGISVPGHLTYISPNQVNVQVPWELEGQASAQVKVGISYSNGNLYTLQLTRSAPSLFEIGGGAVAARDESNKTVTTANAVQAGHIVQLYANSLGPVTNAPASGDPAPASPLARTKSIPTVTIGDQNAELQFSGLAPGFAGLYQVNAYVPAGLAPGTYPVVVTIDGKASKAANLAVR